MTEYQHFVTLHFGDRTAKGSDLGKEFAAGVFNTAFVAVGLVEAPKILTPAIAQHLLTNWLRNKGVRCQVSTNLVPECCYSIEFAIKTEGENNDN